MSAYETFRGRRTGGHIDPGDLDVGRFLGLKGTSAGTHALQVMASVPLASTRSIAFFMLAVLALASAAFRSAWSALTGTRDPGQDEERMLEETFGESFRKYRKRVRRWI